jgi:hypothetical protein
MNKINDILKDVVKETGYNVEHINDQFLQMKGDLNCLYHYLAEKVTDIFIDRFNHFDCYDAEAVDFLNDSICKYLLFDRFTMVSSEAMYSSFVDVMFSGDDSIIIITDKKGTYYVYESDDVDFSGLIDPQYKLGFWSISFKTITDLAKEKINSYCEKVKQKY